MLTLKTRTARTLLAVAFAAAALAAIAALTLSGKAATAAADSPAAPAELIHLAALKAPATAQPVPFLKQDFLAATGYDVASARLLATNAAGSQVIAIPRVGDGSGGPAHQLCILVTEADYPTRGAGACDSIASFNAEGVFVTLSRGNLATDEVVGVLPDGVETVSVASATSQRRTFNVTAGVVRFPRDGASHVTFAGPGGTVDQPIAGGLAE